MRDGEENEERISGERSTAASLILSRYLLLFFSIGTSVAKKERKTMMTHGVIF